VVYHERSSSFPAGLAEHNAGDELGALFFLLVDMAGANFSTPSGEGNPATGIVDQSTVQFDKRVSSYASCDEIVGSTIYQCACNHERQLNKTSPCVLTATGKVDLKPYYEHMKDSRVEEEAAEFAPFEGVRGQGGDAGRGCNWVRAQVNQPQLVLIHFVPSFPTLSPSELLCQFDDDRCQINLGKKLASTAPNASFTWYSFPKCVEGSKWRVLSAGKSVRAYCLIDELAAQLAPRCSSSCGQKVPSGGHYSRCFFNCFFDDVLGNNWNNGTSGAAGVIPAALKPAFATAFFSCPAAALR
jgi:hypothetical protein